MTTLLASNALIKVTPGLMIWTIVAFLITLFVLKRYAFAPVQKMIDDRRDRIRQAIEEADHAREEARRLLEEHKQLIGEARAEADAILSEARRIADASRERAREEAEVDRQRRLEETRRQIEQATHQAIGQIREEVAQLSLLAAEKITRKTLTGDDQQRLIDEALGEIDFSQLEGSRFVATAARIYAQALREAAADKGNVDQVAAELAELRAALEGADDLRAFLENPEAESRVKGDVLVQIAEGADELVVNFLRLLAEKGRAGEIAEIADELARLVAAKERVLDVELTTAHELTETELGGILERIEQASGRKVRSTRKVDPDLIGGIVLQAGSMRLDASVRGRLERLRHELLTARS